MVLKEYLMNKYGRTMGLVDRDLLEEQERLENRRKK
jgi:hypothetical protein